VLEEHYSILQIESLLRHTFYEDAV